MVYFLKISKQQSPTYLSIYESFYFHDVKGTKQRSYKFLGNLVKLIESGINDPISHFKKEVDRLHAQRKQEKLNKKINQKMSLDFLFKRYFV